MRRRMTHPSPYSVKKMDRAKEKEWQEKRRHRKKEKLIKVCITTLIVSM